MNWDSYKQAIVAPSELERKVDWLLRPSAYSERPEAVDARETHMSWVFLTDRFAYKLKKPLRTHLLDFTTVAARRHYCLEEVRLNRRLTSNVYLGVLPLSETGSGFELGSDEHVVDWLVQMRRLPAAQELKHRLSQQAVTERDIDALARRLARFYLSLVPQSITPRSYLDALGNTIDQTASRLDAPPSRLDAELIKQIASRQTQFLQQAEEALATRVRAGRIVEGHGDMRPEHIYLAGQPEVIDCLEFNRDLRVLDIADELSFLSLECERLGAPQFGAELFAAYARFTDDRPPDALRHFYMSYRAMIWAQLATAHPQANGHPRAGHWNERARTYLALAQRHIDEAGNKG
ncbi:hypothetical protein CAI21_17735 [Alkalilimnicola ehrlichii]|uniref:Aminoglycoside phosphotransferase domain-containing protein n=1 Tax=Alkalilimnicola ehrlichii TaxID=351052 RepID=A0A3E0WHF6_9GAMM|nr:hypothetical protein [Alkalilimnicola ehrlichii]RFA26171.1 hypothetical protein CAI21_17735 [Alkalilimnicola ehrlichii]RFA32334.1 hypothetical protein CAL65_19810 [Alkalilimnicola ehrlichii]